MHKLLKKLTRRVDGGDEEPYVLCSFVTITIRLGVVVGYGLLAKSSQLWVYRFCCCWALLFASIMRETKLSYSLTLSSSRRFRRHVRFRSFLVYMCSWDLKIVIGPMSILIFKIQSIHIFNLNELYVFFCW